MRKILSWGIMIIFIGIILCLISLYIQASIETSILWQSILLRFMSNIGLALISVGFISIIINFKDWKNYFQDRLGEVIRRRDYLNTLDKTELIDLQILTLKAFYESEDIDRQGSFLYSFMNKIQYYIAASYRENLIITNDVNINEKEQIELYEIISWNCKKVGDKIQDRIRWEPQSEEFVKLDLIQLKIQCPDEEIGHCPNKCKYSDQCGEPIILKKEDWEKNKVNEGYEFDISEFDHIDGLFIEIKSKYILRPYRFYSVRMAHPTKGFSFTMHYPKTLKIYFDVFGYEKEDWNINDEDCLFTMNTEKWILPLNGFVIQFEKDLGELNNVTS